MNYGLYEEIKMRILRLSKLYQIYNYGFESQLKDEKDYFLGLIHINYLLDIKVNVKKNEF